MPSLAVPPSRPTPALRALGAFFAALPPRAYAGAALAAIALAIVANATLLQRGRPVPTPAVEPVAVAKTPAPPVAAQAPAVSEPAVAAAPPVARTAPSASASASAPAATDPIADLLNGGGGAKDDRKLIASAQTALVKLGYSVKVDGEVDAATQQALADFRKKHGLAASTAVDARLVKTLNAAAGAAAR